MEKECPFCREQKDKQRVVRETKNTFTILSNPYLLKGHCLVVTKKHVEKLSDIPKEMLMELFEEASKVQDLLMEKIGAPGCDIRQNYRPFIPNGEIKVSHFHLHVLPRWFEDELYRKSMIFEKDVFKKLSGEERIALEKNLK